MPNHKSTWKRMYQDRVRRTRNVAEVSRLRTAVKKLRTLCEEGDAEKAQAHLTETLSYIDKASKRHTIHPRNADRKKSRLQRLVNKVGA